MTCNNGFATYVGGNATVGTPTFQEACDGGCCVGNGTATGRFGVPALNDPINSCTLFNGKRFVRVGTFQAVVITALKVGF